MWYFLGPAVFKVELLAPEVGSNFKKKFEQKTQCKIFQGGSVKKNFPHILAPKSGATTGDFPLQKQ